MRAAILEAPGPWNDFFFAVNLTADAAGTGLPAGWIAQKQLAPGLCLGAIW